MAKHSVGIVFWDVEGRSLFGIWKGDRFWECGGAIAFFGMWEGDRFLRM
ncbi:MAG: hypothetical protein ACKPGT_03575 [Microcystis sp.]|jgi:hypothetical protein